MTQRRPLPVTRPHCPQCGLPAWFEREGSGRFKRKGTWANGRWFRFRCPRLRSGRPANHLQQTIDIHGQPVELTRRTFRRQLSGRPMCPGEESSGKACGEPLTLARELKTLAPGEHRYFVCKNIRCDEWNRYNVHLKVGRKWKRVRLVRGPRVAEFGVDRCPKCGEKGTLRSRGRFGKTRQYLQRLRRVKCIACSSVFRLTSVGTLEKAPLPGFQRAHDPPRCPQHGEMVRSSNSRRADVGIVYLWRCRRRRCRERALLDRRGNPVPAKKPAPKERIAFGCEMPGCFELRTDQVDWRKRYCPGHTRLSYFQRWKHKRRLQRALDGDQTMRPGAKVFRGLAIPADDRRKAFGRLLRSELNRQNLTPGAAARRTLLPVGTVQNWVRGVSLPRDWEEFNRFLRALGIDAHLFESYYPRGRPAPGGR